MNTLTRLLNYIALLLICVLFSGCAGMQAISNYARSGDTVMISLGGTDSNALVSVIRKENVTISITDSLGNSYPVKVRNLFRVNGDPTSGYAFRSPTTSMVYDNYVDPHQGLWLAVIDLVDPVSDTPVPLAVGSATLTVSSADIQNWFDPTSFGWFWTNGNLSSVAIEILAGTGTPNPMNYLGPVSSAPLDSLEPNPQVEVTATGSSGGDIGGGLFVFSFQNADFGGALSSPRAVVTVPDPNIQMLSNLADQGDGTSKLNVVIVNPHGFKTGNDKAGLVAGQSLRRSLRFSLVWSSGNTTVNDANWQSLLQLDSGSYFDLDGNDIPALVPGMTKTR